MMAAKPKRTAGDDHLPPEIWTEMLIRVPVKSILRCRSVCKSLYSLVSCPSFISYYSTKTLIKNRILLYHSDTKSVSFSSLDESFKESREHDDFPMTSKDLFGGFRFVGSCNGLICLSKYTKDSGGFWRFTFLVWNPTIRKVVELRSRTKALFPSYIGFGFDSKTSNYKVLFVVGNVGEIFYLSDYSWRSIGGIIMPLGRFGSNGQECYLDGAVHWTNSRDMVLLSFNMSDECFRDIKMPDLCRSSIDIRSVAFRGLINVIAWDTKWSCSVWVMKEYGVAESWTKVSDISLPINQIEPTMSSTLLWGDGEVLLVNEADFGSGKHLVSYNTERRIFKEVSQIIDKRVANMCLYEESLVLM